MVTKGDSGGGGDKLGVWDQHIHTTIYKIDKPQGPILDSTRNHPQYLIITYNGKESEKEYIYMCVCIYTHIYDN